MPRRPARGRRHSHPQLGGKRRPERYSASLRAWRAGGALGPIARQFFDPQIYRIIYIHQRSAGNSTPRGETRQNTTQLLISDIETLRKARNVDRWIMAGGSWGSTLAL